MNSITQWINTAVKRYKHHIISYAFEKGSNSKTHLHTMQLRWHAKNNSLYEKENLLPSRYVIFYFEYIKVNIKINDKIEKKLIYLPFGIDIEGNRWLLGLWPFFNHDINFWLEKFLDLKKKFVQDILIACCDGPSEIFNALKSIYPETKIEFSVLDKLYHSLNMVHNQHDKREITSDLKSIYTAKSLNLAQHALNEFSNKWNIKYPTLSDTWKNDWQRIIHFFTYPADIRQAIYGIEIFKSLNEAIDLELNVKNAFISEAGAIHFLKTEIDLILNKNDGIKIQNWNTIKNRIYLLYHYRFNKNSETIFFHP